MRFVRRGALGSCARGAAASAVAALGLSGCAAQIERNGIADAQVAKMAEIRHMPGVRFWADDVVDDPIAEMKRRLPNMPPIASTAKKLNGRPVIETLALSGGGADGAFGAGLLAGWTERGDRPEFEIVTGVSAGAIIAPFAYLGASEDENSRRIWTEYYASEVVTAQILPGLLGGDALADTTPLAGLIAKYVDHEMMRRVAAEYHRGRILLVLTTNLDAQRPVVWNMGEIARIGTEESLDLFRKVIRASAAIPGAFPPVNIAVTADGKSFEEMHVDGGTTREIFVLPVQAPFQAFDRLYPTPPLRKLYLVKNGKLNAEQTVVQQTTLPIAGRAIATLIKSQNWSELYRIYRLAKDDKAEFNLAFVPETFTATTKQIYDPQYQKALYQQGVESGRASQWSKSPPGQTSIIAKGRGAKPAFTLPQRSAPIAPAPDAAPPAPAPDAPSAWAPTVSPVANVANP